MRILVTNDDGIGAGQLIPLIQWCRKLGEVTVFAPKFEQSAKSHCINIHSPFEIRQVELSPDIIAWRVDSTPADCVRTAVLGMGMGFDLVISGVNRGLNIGADIMYSGTVAAASEAANQGIPAIALSTSPENYPNATEQLDRVWTFIEAHGLLGKADILNVNIPEKAKEIRITRQDRRPYFSDEFVPIGNDLYRPCGRSVWIDSHDDTLDTDATLHGYLTVTPLSVIRTDEVRYRSMAHLSEKIAVDLM